MNMLMLAGMAANNTGLGSSIVGDSCAAFLFVSGAVSLVAAFYLLYKAPKLQPIRYVRKR